VNQRAAESLQSREIGEQLGRAVKGLVYLEEVRVAMDQQDLAGKLFCFGDHAVDEIAVAADARRLAFILAFGLGQVKAGVCLKHQHQAARLFCLGVFEGFLHPDHVGSVAFQVFSVAGFALGGVASAFVGAVFFVQNFIVVAAGNVQGRKDDAVVAKACVFNKFLAQLALMRQRQLALAQAAICGKHDFAYVR